jgi:lysophospholipase L1-like esterase
MFLVPQRTGRRSVLAVFVLLLLVPGLASCGLPGQAPTAAPVSVGSRRAPAGTGPLTFVALGASDAYGVGTEDPASQSWPSALARQLGPNVHLVNLGIPGETLGQALQAELPVALGVRPDLVTVWLAVNDFTDGVPLPAYQSQLQALLTQLATTHARVYVADIPDLTALPAFAAQDVTTLRARVQQWNTTIAAVCVASGAHLVDLYSYGSQLAAHPEYVSADGFHPSALGAQRLAQLFATAIRQTGGA